MVTTRLNSRWRAWNRTAWAMIVGGANPERPVSTWAPTAWPDSLIPSIASLIAGTLHRVGHPYRERRPHRGDTVAQRAALEIGRRDRHHRLEHEFVGRVARPAQVATQGARDHREHYVVDGPAERVLDRLELGQVALHPGEPAVRTDPHVERARRRAGLDRAEAAPTSPLNVKIGPHRRFTWVQGDLAQFKAIKNRSAGRSTTSCWRLWLARWVATCAAPATRPTSSCSRRWCRSRSAPTSSAARWATG